MSKGTVVLAAAAIGIGALLAAAHGQVAAPGDTGATRPDDVVLARQILMGELATQIAPLDDFAAGGQGELEDLKARAASISNVLLAFPHLFPPETNYNAAAESVSDFPTTALPAIWENFEDFYALSTTASEIALAASQVTDVEALREQAAALRGACDGCHALYIQPYEPPF